MGSIIINPCAIKTEAGSGSVSILYIAIVSSSYLEHMYRASLEVVRLREAEEMNLDERVKVSIRRGGAGLEVMVSKLIVQAVKQGRP